MIRVRLKLACGFWGLDGKRPRAGCVSGVQLGLMGSVGVGIWEQGVEG